MAESKEVNMKLDGNDISEEYTGKNSKNYVGKYLSSYFALISLHKNFHEPRTISSGRKVCVVVVGGSKVSLVLALVQKTRIWILDLDLDQAEQYGMFWTLEKE